MRWLETLLALAVAVLRWSVGTTRRRRVTGLCDLLLVAWCLAGPETIARGGSWRGLDRSIAPHKGRITLEGTLGGTGRCTVQGEDTTAVGNGWVFRGKTTVHEVTCALQIDREGTVNALLQVRMEWHGRIKGIGGDGWDDADGYGDCVGPLVGKLTPGTGAWHGECRNERHRWPVELEWTLDRD
jgi:hypothetical protein